MERPPFVSAVFAVPLAALALIALSTSSTAGRATAVALPPGFTLKLVAAGAGTTFPDSFAALHELVTEAARTGELRIALPLRADGAFEGLSVPDVQIAFDEAHHAFALSGRISSAGVAEDVVVAGTWSGTEASPRCVLGLRPASFDLAARTGSARGTALDGIDLGGSAFTLAEREWPSLAGLGSAAAWFGTDEIALHPGWTVSGSLPLASLPASLRAASGLPASGAIRVSGTIVADLGFVTGRGSVKSVELSAAIPGAGTATRWPAWMTPVERGERRLTIAFEAPSKVTVGVGCDVQCELGGEMRRFRLSTGGGTSTSAEFRAEMVSPWKAPFGLAWIDMSGATLRGTADGATLEGRFDIAGQAASATLDIGARGPTKLTVTIGEIALADLVKSGAIDALPEQVASPLASVLDGAALELRSASIGLEPSSRTLTLAAQVSLRGTRSDFFYVTELPHWQGFAPRIGDGKPDSTEPETKSGSRASFFALRPIQISLGKLFPRMLSIEALKDLASCDLGVPAIFGGSGQLAIDLPQMPGLPKEWSNVFAQLSLPSWSSESSGSPGTVDASTDGSSTSNGFGFGKLHFPSGLHLSGRIPLGKLPAGGRFASMLGIAQRLGDWKLDGLDLSGTFGAKLEDLHLGASLPEFSVNPKMPWLAGGRLHVDIAGSGTLSIAGSIRARVQGEPLAFTVALDAQKSAEQSATASIDARCDGVWKKALGIDWLELSDIRLALAPAADGGLQAACGASFPIGTRSARVEIALDGKEDASVLAKLDRIALSDLVTLAHKNGSGAGLEKSGLGGALALTDVELELRRAQQQTSLRFACSTQIAGHAVDMLVAIEPRGGASSTRVALHVPDVQLGALLPALHATPADLRFPSSLLTFGDGVGDADSKLASSATALDLRRWVPAGSTSGELLFHPGLHLAGSVPLDGLPETLRRALGLADDGAALAFDGSIDATLGALGGTSAIRSVELRAVLPATSRSMPFPRWMTNVDSGPRTVRLSYASGAGVAVHSSRTVAVAIGGAARKFELLLDAQKGGGTAGATFTAEMAEPWTHPFGLTWADLEHATLRGSLTSGADAHATLEGGFELWGHAATLSADLAFGAQAASGRVAVRVDTLALADFARLGLAERLPTEALDAIGGAQLEVRGLEIAAEIGKERSLSVSGRVMLRGMPADVALVVTDEGAPVLAFRPDRLSLGAVAPRLLENEATRDIAARDLSGLFVLAGSRAKSISARELPEALAACMPKSSGSSGESVPLSPGLNLLAPLGPDALPKDGLLAQALERLRDALGVSGGGLQIRGTIGRSAADLDLAIELPPIEPRRAPKWLESGQLSLVVTGKPSLSVHGRVVVLVDGEHLPFLLDGSLTRVGASPAVKLFGALETQKPWQSPFGIDWMELDRVGVGIAIDATGSVTPSFAGKMKVGAKDLEVAAKVRISPAGVPIGGMFLGKSDAGFALSDLAALQARIAGGVARGAGSATVSTALLPDVAVRDFELKLAPHDEPEEHVTQGLAVRGTLLVAARKGAPATRELALVDVAIGKEGLHGEGALAAQKIGPLELDDARVRFALERGEQHFTIEGGAQVLGRKQAIALAITRESLAFDAQADLGGKWRTDVHVGAPFDLEMPKFSAAGLLPDDLVASLRDLLSGEGEKLGQGCQDALVLAHARLQEAQKRRDERRQAMSDLKTKLEKELAAAKSEMEKAQQEALVARGAMDAAKKAWDDAPDSKPVLKAARKKAYDVARDVYELSSSAKKKVYELKQAALAALPKPADSKPFKAIAAAVESLVDEVKQRQTAVDALEQALAPIAAFHSKHPGMKLIELKRGDFELDLAALTKGGSLPVDFEVRWLEDVRRVKGELSFSDLAAAMHAVAQTVFPKLP